MTLALGSATMIIAIEAPQSIQLLGPSDFDYLQVEYTKKC